MAPPLAQYEAGKEGGGGQLHRTGTDLGKEEAGKRIRVVKTENKRSKMEVQNREQWDFIFLVGRRSDDW